MNELTGREKQIMQLIALGQSNQQIADKLHISLSTVKNHNSAINDKLQTVSRNEVQLIYWQNYLNEIKQNLLDYGVNERIINEVIG